MSTPDVTLRELLRTIAEKHYHNDYKLDIKSINSGGANYTSALFLAVLTAEGKEALHLFAKVAIVGDRMRVLMNATKMFYVEDFFYNKLIKTYEDIQDKHGVVEDRFAVPKFYGCHSEFGEETIVLENLTVRGYSGYDRLKSLDWEHASSAVEELAKFHALSFAYQKEQPEEFRLVMNDLWFYKPNSDASVSESYFPKMISRALSHITNDDYRERVKKLMLCEASDMYEKYNRPFGHPVLVHGDYRASNLFFKKKDDKFHTIPVDFQTVHAGCVATDLIYFVFGGTDSSFREKHLQPLFELYYGKLCAAMKRLGVDSSEVYPRKEFDRELKEVLPYAVFLGITVLPVALVEAENAPRVDGDSDVKNFLITPNDLYVERFRGIIDDCVRLGAI